MTDNLVRFDARKVSNSRLNDQLEAHEEAIKAVTNNEIVTRHRVDLIEGLLRRGFLGRLRWLCLGS